MTNVAINGLGRIGRASLKILMETPGLNLVAANDIGTPESIEYLLRYDTVYGRYEKPVKATDDGHLQIGDRRVRLLHERDPGQLPWKAMRVDIVFECTGAFITREDLAAHVRAGAGYVILSAPSKGDGVETIVHGVNTPKEDTTIVSCASCTTNCITPVMEMSRQAAHGRSLRERPKCCGTNHCRLVAPFMIRLVFGAFRHRCGRGRAYRRPPHAG